MAQFIHIFKTFSIICTRRVKLLYIQRELLISFTSFAHHLSELHSLRSIKNQSLKILTFLQAPEQIVFLWKLVSKNLKPGEMYLGFKNYLNQVVPWLHSCMLLISFSLLSYQNLFVLVLYNWFEIPYRKTQRLENSLKTCIIGNYYYNR